MMIEFAKLNGKGPKMKTRADIDIFLSQHGINASEIQPTKDKK